MQDANAVAGKKDLLELIEEVSSCRVNYVRYLRPVNETGAKAEFFAKSKLAYPNYEYNEVDEKILGKKRMHINSMLHEVMDRKDLAKDLKLAFLKDLGQSWYFTELISVAYDYNHGIEKAQAKKRFKRASDAALGRMHEDTFWSLLRERVASINNKKLKEDERIIYQEMFKYLGVMGRNRKKRYAPSPAIVRKFSAQMKVLFGSILKHIPEDKNEYTVEDAARIINEIIEEELHIPFTAEVDEELLTASTYIAERKILLPGGRCRNYNRIELEKLIVHELGVHAVRAVSADAGDLPIFSYPKSGAYSRLTEEGLAKVCEQAIDGKYDDICIVRYIAIGLAQVCKKNFRQCFEILWRLEALTSGRSKDDCFSIVQRVFRGTGVLPINTDLIYYRGYALVWQYIEAHIDDEDLIKTLFLSGKNDFLEQERETLFKTMREDGLIEDVYV